MVVAFLGWLFAGVHMSITQLAGQAAAIDLLNRTGDLDARRYLELNKLAQSKSALSDADREQLDEWKPSVARWFAWFQCSFLFGAASGGLLFGWLGDRIGRARAMAASIAAYSLLAAAASLAQSPLQLCALWFLACTGVGGMWPNGVALVSEAWSGMSRPMVAGVIGVAANIGIFLFATLTAFVAIRFDDWRWAMLIGAGPIVLGVAAWLLVPESPRWLQTQHPAAPPKPESSTAITAQEPRLVPEPAPARVGRENAMRRSLLGVTLIAIVLATIPMIGGWGTANWMNPWAEEVGGAELKAYVLQTRSLTGIIGSLLGGWIANAMGRRLSYFLVSLLSLAFAQYIFLFLTPTDDSFLYWVAALGFVSGVYFGWLPLCLPELFPTHYRATGAGIGFNFGRIVTAITIFIGGALMQFFEGRYDRVGQWTSLLFVLGMIFIWFAPDTSKNQLED